MTWGPEASAGCKSTAIDEEPTYEYLLGYLVRVLYSVSRLGAPWAGGQATPAGRGPLGGPRAENGLEKKLGTLANLRVLAVPRVVDVAGGGRGWARLCLIQRRAMLRILEVGFTYLAL